MKRERNPGQKAAIKRRFHWSTRETRAQVLRREDDTAVF